MVKGNFDKTRKAKVPPVGFRGGFPCKAGGRQRGILSKLSDMSNEESEDPR